MNLRIASLLLLVLACYGCGDAELESKSTETQSNTASMSVPPDALVTLERTGCYPGRCPSYKLTISADGAVVYEGKDHVKMRGRAEGRISRKDLELIISRFEELNYFSLGDNYVHGANCPSYVTDSPTAITSLRIGGRERFLVHYHGCVGTDTLRRLTGLEASIDEAVGTNQWVG